MPIVVDVQKLRAKVKSGVVGRAEVVVAFRTYLENTKAAPESATDNVAYATISALADSGTGAPPARRADGGKRTQPFTAVPLPMDAEVAELFDELCAVAFFKDTVAELRKALKDRLPEDPDALNPGETPAAREVRLANESPDARRAREDHKAELEEASKARVAAAKALETPETDAARAARLAGPRPSETDPAREARLADERKAKAAADKLARNRP